MEPLTIRPLQWKRVADLLDLAPLDAHDLACMAELRAVLARHGRLDRFAVHLVHRHFPLADNEVLVEYTDIERREHRLRVARRDDPVARRAIPTTWMIDAASPLVVCVCAARGNQGHLGRHESG